MDILCEYTWILESQKSMQILSTRSKASSRKSYESFTSNKRCKSYVRDKDGTYSQSGWLWKLHLQKHVCELEEQ
jgi:hypothetical protein